MNVSSVKNLNGEVFSAVQDASLTNVVQTNSGNWQDITAYQNNSASYQPSGNYIPYTAVDISNTAFKTNSGLSIDRFGEGGLYSTLLSPNTIQMFFVASPTSYYGSILADTSLKFETQSDSAYVDKETYAEILDKYNDIRSEIMEKSYEEDDHMIICYTKIITDIHGFHKDLERYEELIRIKSSRSYKYWKFVKNILRKIKHLFVKISRKVISVVRRKSK